MSTSKQQDAESEGVYIQCDGYKITSPNDGATFKISTGFLSAPFDEIRSEGTHQWGLYRETREGMVRIGALGKDVPGPVFEFLENLRGLQDSLP